MNVLRTFTFFRVTSGYQIMSLIYTSHGLIASKERSKDLWGPRRFQLVDACAEDINADFVLYDVGPNIGPLNRAILLDCDYFIVPAACDYFSTRALKTLGHSISSWIRDGNLISKIAPNDVPQLNGRPVYLGYVLQRFRMYGGDISSGYSQYARQLDRHSYSDVAAVLQEIDKELARGSLSQFKLGQIKDFATLANLAKAQQGTAMSRVDGERSTKRKKLKLLSKNSRKK